MASSVPVAEPARTSTRPPVLPDAARRRKDVMLVRFVGANDHQSPSSMKPMFWKPPAVSPVASRCTPGSPVAVEPATRPVAVKYSACLRLGWSVMMARPVSPPRSAYVASSTAKMLASVPWPVASEVCTDAGAAGRLLELVRVLVVPERVAHDHPGAVDRAVLRVGHGDRVGDLVAPLVEAAVRRAA